jgi:uncharacterized membrane protein
MKNTKKMILAALFAALTFTATAIIKIQTPTIGYIHPGDAMVILSGVILGPGIGGFAAGFGSMLSDIVGGYFIYAPATFLIKFLDAFLAGVIAKLLFRIINPKTSHYETAIPVLIGGMIGELVMVAGYFLFEIFLLAYKNGGFDSASLIAGVTASASGIPFNLVQGIFGVVVATVLYPIVNKLARSDIQ